MEKTFNRKLMADIGDMVFFIKLSFGENDNDGIELSMKNVFQGQVVRISGAADLAISLTVVMSNGEKYSACQEVFSKDLQQILDIIKYTDGVITNDIKGDEEFDGGWPRQIVKACGEKLVYPYELQFPFKPGTHFEKIKTYSGCKENVSLTRCIFGICLEGYITHPWSGRIDYQLSPINGVVYSANSLHIDDTKLQYDIVKIK